MRTQSICLALAIVLLCPLASAQFVQTNSLRNRQIAHPSVPRVNFTQEAVDELSGSPSKHKLQTDINLRFETFRAEGSSYPRPNDRLMPSGIQRSLKRNLEMSSPQSQFYVIDTAVVRRLGNGAEDPGDTTRHLYSFNAHAKRTLDLTQRLKGDIWVDSLRQSNTYDAENRELTWVSEYWSNGQWLRSEDGTRTYDQRGNCLTDLYRVYHAGQLHHYSRDSSTYDAQGRRLFHVRESWTDGYPVNSQRSTYFYIAETNRDSVFIEVRSGTDAWKPDWRTVTIRDTLGRMISQVDEALYGGVVSPLVAFRRTWTYDSQGNVLTSLSEDYYSFGYPRVVSSSYTHDTQGRMLSWVRADWSNGVLTDSTRITQTFDARGLFLLGVHETWRNGLWELTWRWTETYDEQGKRLSSVGEGWSAGLLDSYHRSTCTYDGQGRLLSEVREDWSTGRLADSTRTTYTYDAEGNLIEVWHHGWLSSSWIPVDFEKPMGELFEVTDNADNRYSFDGYNLSFARRLIVTEVVSESRVAPGTYSLSQNYPNPFNPSTTIKYELPKSSDVRLSVFDILGREVSVLVNERKDAGVHEVKFEPSGLSSGVYFYRIEAGSFVQTRKLMILR